MSVNRIETGSIVYHKEDGLGVVAHGGDYHVFVKFDNPSCNNTTIFVGAHDEEVRGRYVSTTLLSVLGSVNNFRLATGAANPHKRYITKRTDPVKERLAKIKEQLKRGD